MSARLFTVNNKADHAEILITGTIGGSFWDESGMTEKAFLDALKEIPKNKPLVVGINSEGGSIQDGLGIYNAIKRWEGPTTARIDGYAVSIASVIPLAAQRVISPKSSIWMIHEPWMVAQGNAEDMLKAAEVLEKHGETLSRIYQEETGLTIEDVRAKMKRETWFRGDEAVAMGFADEESDASACFNSFDASRFHNCPADILKTICASAVAHTQKGLHAEAARTEQTPLLSPPLSAAGDVPDKTAANTAKENQNSMPEITAPVAADNAAILAKLEALENKINAPAPLAPSPIVNLGNPAVEKYNSMDHGRARADFIKSNYDVLKRELAVGDVRGQSIDSGLANSLLSSEVVDTMRTYVAPLAAFTRQVATSPISPRQTINIPLASSAGSIQTNPSNFETGDTTQALIAVTVNQYSKSFFCSHAEGNSGLQLAQFAPTNAMVLAEGIMALVTAKMIVANFGSTTTIGAAASFDATDLPAILALGKNYGRTTLLLDGGHLAYLLPTSRESFVFGEPGAYGFDGGIYKNNLWTGATTNCAGFLAGPNSIVIASGQPANLPNGEMVSQQVVQIGAGLSVTSSVWFSRSSRAMWGSYDIMFGCAVGDGTQGEVLVTS